MAPASEGEMAANAGTGERFLGLVWFKYGSLIFITMKYASPTLYLHLIYYVKYLYFV